jgi:hypothetical protein
MRLITWEQLTDLTAVSSQLEFDDLDFTLRKLPILKIASKLGISEEEAKALRQKWQRIRTASPYSLHGKIGSTFKRIQ